MNATRRFGSFAQPLLLLLGWLRLGGGLFDAQPPGFIHQRYAMVRCRGPCSVRYGSRERPVRFAFSLRRRKCGRRIIAAMLATNPGEFFHYTPHDEKTADSGP